MEDPVLMIGSLVVIANVAGGFFYWSLRDRDVPRWNFFLTMVVAGFNLVWMLSH